MRRIATSTRSPVGLPRRPLCVAAALVVLLAALAPRIADAQELEPRSYVNTPVGMNFLIAGYAYTKGSVVFNPTTKLTDAEIETHAAILGYARALDLWGLSGKFAMIVPFADASGSALQAGQLRERDVSGLADPRFRLSVNFYGAPALRLEEFGSYEQDLIVGATLEVAVPLGQYDSDKLVNIGSNRWSVKPEIGISKAIGRFNLELAAAVTFFTANSDFLGGRTLEQDPIYSVQGHVVYEAFRGLWAALDATYYAGGRTKIDGKAQEGIENIRLGLTISIPINRYNSIKLYGSKGVYSRSGTNFDGLGIAWQLRWGGGL
jgi:hypothetical protein